MCAKVTGPLFSIGARGKLGKAIVYSAWKGINVVREYLKPANPQSGDQGDRRTILAGMGRSAKYVQKEKVYHTFALAVTPSGQSWISKYVQYIIEKYMKTVALYEVETAELAAHGAVNDWYAQALTLGLTDYSCGYEGNLTGFGHGLQLYEMAKYGCDQYLLDNTKFNAAPYTKALSTWIEADIILMVADFSA